MTAVGVFGIGLAAYWPQFEGLKERIEGYQRRVEERVGELGGEVVSAGLVDSEQAAREAGDRFAQAQVDLVLCHAVTYATSSTVLPVVQAAKAPVVLLGLQPAGSLDYANTGTGEWLANCAACCVPELAGAFTRARIPYDTVAGTIDGDERAWAKIAAWVRAAGVARELRRARIGFLGHVYPGMLDMYADFTMVHAQVGAHVEVLEIDDLGVRVARATRRRGRGQGGRDPRDVRVRRPLRRPDRRADRGRAARLVGARGGRARQARRGLRARRADLLLPRRRGQRGRAARRRRDRGQLAADRARRPDRGRGRPQDQPRAADPRPARRRRLLHRVLRARLRRGVRADGPRRPRPRRDRAGAADAARAPALPRQARRRAERRVQGPLRPGHDRRLHPDRRRAAEAAGRRGRVDPRRDVPDRQHQQPPALRPSARRVLRALVRARARPTTSRSASATWPARCGASRRSSASSTRRWRDGARLLPAARPPGAARRVQGAPPRGVAGDARRAARVGLAQLLAVPAARTGCWSATSRPRTSRRRSARWRPPRSTTAGSARWPSSSASAPTRGSCASRRSSTLPDYAAVDLGATSGRVADRPAARRAGRADRGAPLREPPGAAPRRPALEPPAPVHRVPRRPAPRRRASTASASTPGASTTRCSTPSDRVLGLPFHYRDDRTEGMVERAFERVPAERLYAATGIQTMPINTVFQLLADEGSAALDAAQRIALVPDLLALWLCGELANERTNASTTGLLDARSGEWAGERDRRARAAGAPVRAAGRARHRARAAARPPRPRRPDGLRGRQPRHRVGVRRRAGADEHAAILSSGTWSLLGLELPEPVLSAAAREANLTNERGDRRHDAAAQERHGAVAARGVPPRLGRPALRRAAPARRGGDRRRAAVRPRRRGAAAPRRHDAADRRRLRGGRPERPARARRGRAQHPRLARLQVPLDARAARGRQRPRDPPHPRRRRRRAQRAAVPADRRPVRPRGAGRRRSRRPRSATCSCRRAPPASSARGTSCARSPRRRPTRSSTSRPATTRPTNASWP